MSDYLVKRIRATLTAYPLGRLVAHIAMLDRDDD